MAVLEQWRQVPGLQILASNMGNIYVIPYERKTARQTTRIFGGKITKGTWYEYRNAHRFKANFVTYTTEALVKRTWG